MFLFEKAILICKRKTDDPSPTFHQTSIAMAHHHNQSPQWPGQQLFASNTQSFSTSSTSTLSSVSSSNGTTASIGAGFNLSSLSSYSAAFNGFQHFYQFKEMMKTNEIGLTENMKNDKKKFEIWSDTFSYIFEATNELEKHEWISLIKSLLESQLNEMKCKI